MRSCAIIHPLHLELEPALLKEKVLGISLGSRVNCSYSSRCLL